MPMSTRDTYPADSATWLAYPTDLEKSSFNKKSKSFGDNKNAYEYFERMQEHLKENGLKLEETDYIVGRASNSTLKLSPSRESGSQRSTYPVVSGTNVVPEKV